MLTRQYIITHSEEVHRKTLGRAFLPVITNQPEPNDRKGKGKDKNPDWADIAEEEADNAIVLRNEKIVNPAERNVLLLCLLLGINESAVRNVYMHGSRVWGTSHPESDWYVSFP